MEKLFCTIIVVKFNLKQQIVTEVIMFILCKKYVHVRILTVGAMAATYDNRIKSLEVCEL